VDRGERGEGVRLLQVQTPHKVVDHRSPSRPRRQQL
jgi:hypothetical protein